MLSTIVKNINYKSSNHSHTDSTNENKNANGYDEKDWATRHEAFNENIT